MIETSRLILREHIPEDFAAIHRIFSDPITMRFWPRPFTEEEMHCWIDRATSSYAAHGFGRWVMALKDTSEIIGDAGLMRLSVNGNDEVDLGYIVHHTYWRQGYGSEAAREILDFGLENGCRRIIAHMAYDNIASQRVAVRIGLTKETEYINPRDRGILHFLYSNKK